MWSLCICVYVYMLIYHLSLYINICMYVICLSQLSLQIPPNNQIFMSLIQLHILSYNLHILHVQVYPLVFEIISGLFTPVVIFYIALKCT